MKKLILYLSLLISVCAFGQADSNMVEIQGKATIADTDVIIVSGADTVYWKVTYAQLKTLLNALYEGELDNSAGLLAALDDETGTGVAVFSTSPVLVTPTLGAATGTDFTTTGQSVYMNTGQTVSIKAGAVGSPEGQVTAGIGSLWLATDGTTNTTLWRKEAGVGNTGWVAVTANTTLTDEEVQDLVGAMVTGNTETNITVTYQDADGTLDFVVSAGGSVGDADSLGGVPADSFYTKLQYENAYDVDNNKSGDKADSVTRAYGVSPLDSTVTIETLDARTVTAADATPFVMSVGDTWVTRTIAQQVAGLQLTIGTYTQAYDAVLTTYASITPSANTQTLLSNNTFADWRVDLDLEVGTDFSSVATVQTKADTSVYPWGVMDTVTVGDLVAYQVESNITIIKVAAYGTTDSVTFNIQERTAPNTPGDSLFATPMVAPIAGRDSTSFSGSGGANFTKGNYIMPVVSNGRDATKFGITVWYIKQSY